MLKSTLFACLGFVLLSPSLLDAGVPLPSVTLFGTIHGPSGAPVGSGIPSAVVTRGGSQVLNVEGEFVLEEGTPFFVIRVPMEAGIEAPGPQTPAAREGDLLSAIALNGVPVAEPGVVLAAGVVRRINGETGGGSDAFFRGDCDGDGTLQLTDAVFLLSFLFTGGAEPGCHKACDADDDSVLQLTDAIFSLGFLFLGGEPLPPPTGGCGADPGTSSLTCAQSGC